MYMMENSRENPRAQHYSNVLLEKTIVKEPVFTESEVEANVNKLTDWNGVLRE
jgi:hypothetical protein